MSPEIKERWEEHKYALELNNFLLSLYHLRICAVLAAWGYGMPDSEVSAILGINPQYCAMIRSVRDRFPNYSEEELAQEVFNMVRVFDGGRTYKRDYSHFQKLDEKALNEWHSLRERQKRFHNDYLNLDAILSDAQHAYFAVTGRDITWKEIEEKNEQLEQQEIEPDEQTQFQRDAERLGEIEEQERRMDLLTELIRNNEITPEIAFKYIHDESMDFDTFLRVLDIWVERQEERTDG